MKQLTRIQKNRLKRALVSGLGLGALLVFCPEGHWGLLFLAPYLIAGYDVLWTAVGNIRRGRVFDENFLMTIATIGAFLCGEYPEGVMVMVLYQLGELAQSIAVGRSRQSISALMELCPEEARVLRRGEAEMVPPEDVETGEILEIWPGEKVPLDGTVLSGASTLDTAPLTGESIPRPLEPGAAAFSGCVNLSGVIRVAVTRAAEESSAAKIIQMMESATEKKARTEQFITRFSRVYTPIVCLAAMLLTMIPSVLTGQWQVWLYRAMTFLVISCPCALVISVPLTFFGGIGMASRRGILVRSGGDLEKLSGISTMAFDKTGTLTEGVFSVKEIISGGAPAEYVLEKAAYAEAASNHPLALGVLRAYSGRVDESRVTERQEIPGQGLSARVDGRWILAGNRRFLMEKGICGLPETAESTAVFVAEDGAWLGTIVCQDFPRPEAETSLEELRHLGVTRLVMLTGDREAVGKQVGETLGLDEVYSELLPGDKLSRVEQLISREQGGLVCYAGDGINDAPVLRRADLGIAMGAMGTDAAIEAADVVLMENNLARLPEAMVIARKTMKIARQNIGFALGIKCLVLILGALGRTSMYLAVFADVGVSLLAILNACRLMAGFSKSGGQCS